MLTDAKIKKLPIPPATQKSPDKYSDIQGLQLHVFSTGVNGILKLTPFTLKMAK